MTSTTEAPEEKYLKAIKQLKPTGPEGFEGFVRDLLQENLGTKFRLMKSGHQGGVDMANEPYGNTLSIGVEGKRYGSTSLSLDALKYKIYEAAQSPAGIDLWVLAATREVSATDAQILRREGEKHGISVTFLDTSRSSGSIPPLSLLGAAAPDVVKEHLGDKPEINDYLRGVRKEDQYEVLRDRLLEQFIGSQIGYENARLAAANWLRNAFLNEAAARTKLHCFADINGPEVRRVRRDAISSKLDQWWHDGAAFPLALLGSEGVGKTWSVLAWWEERDNAEYDRLPLTLVVPAEAIQYNDPVELLASLMEQCSGHRSENPFWLRRLSQWQKSYEGRPKILLIIDGLNQRPLYRDWATLLQPLFAEEWKGRVAIIMTCRAQYWKDDLRQLANLKPRSEEMSIVPFSDQEVDALLVQYGLSREKFSAAFQQLLRIPRLCQLAILRHRELEASCDITPERLVYEDWKHRIDVHGSDIAISDHEFLELIARVGQRLQHELSKNQNAATITRKEILDELSIYSGESHQKLAQTLSELIDGHWFQQIENKPNRFSLNNELAPFALGLTLVNSLQLKSEVEAEECFAQFLEPLRGMDFGTDILRAASTVAVLDSNCPDTIRQLLIMRWVSEQNFKLRDFEALWRLMGEAPEMFLDILEEIWLWPERGVFNDEVFISSLVKASRWDSFAEALHRRLVKWLGLYTLDPVRGQVIGYQHDDPKVKERRENTRKRRRQWDNIVTELGSEYTVSLVEVEVDDAGQGANPSWLSHRAAGVLSFLPRAKFVQAFLAWAVSRCVMGSPRHFDEMAWTLRLNPIDAEETSQRVMVVADRLIAQGHEVALDAGRFLLEALATPAAVKKASEFRPSGPQVPSFPGTVEYDSNTHVVIWKYQEALGWPRSQECPLDAALGLNAVAGRPQAILEAAGIQVLRSLPETVDSSEFWRLPRQHSRIDSNLETAEDALAHWAPDVLGDLLRGIYDSITGRDIETGWGVVYRLPEHLLLMKPEQLDRLSKFSEQALTRISKKNDDHFPWLNLQLARMLGKSAAEQIAILEGKPVGPMFYLKHGCVLDAPTEDDFKYLEKYLKADASTDQLRVWLTYQSLVDLEALPDDYGPYTRLISHNDAGIRELVLKQIIRSDRTSLLKAVDESGLSWKFKAGSTEGIYGSLALCRASKHMEVNNLFDRIEPRAISELVIQYPDDEVVLEHFLAVVRDEFKLQAKGKSWPVSQVTWSGLDKALEIIGCAYCDELIGLLDAHITNNPAPSTLFSFDSFPVISTLTAVLKARPEEGARVWSKLWSNYLGGSWLIDAFEKLPFSATEHPSVLPLRERVLNEAKTDADLQKCATWAEQYGCVNWLIGYIYQHVEGVSSGEMARGMTLAGFLDRSDVADPIWADLLKIPLYGGWLEHVRNWAHYNYEQNVNARYWLNAFLSEVNPDRAFSNYVLFVECADARALKWGPSSVSRVYDQLPKLWQCHWSMNDEQLKKKVEKRTKDNEKYLFGTKIFKDTHSPWLSIN